MVSAGSIFTNHRNYGMFNPLTEFPHMRSRLRSTLWPNGHEMRCKGHDFLAWRKDPETKWTWANRRAAPNIIHSVERTRGLYRHRAFVSCEFIQMFACFCFPDHYQLVHITSGLQKKWIIGRKWRCISANRSRTSYQIFSIWWDSHTQDVTSVPNMSVLCSFPSTWNCVQLLPTLDIPCRNLNQKY